MPLACRFGVFDLSGLEQRRQTRAGHDRLWRNLGTGKDAYFSRSHVCGAYMHLWPRIAADIVKMQLVQDIFQRITHRWPVDIGCYAALHGVEGCKHWGQFQ